MNYQIIIPARGGSKRFPQKNVSLLGGIPLISHSILFALENFPKEKIWINTDDQLTEEIAGSYGVNITQRPKELASDTSTTAEVLRFQQNIFIDNRIECDAQILLQATNPFRPKNLIYEAISLFEDNRRNSLASFTILDKKYGKIQSKYYKPINYKPGDRIQDIDKNYFENGLIYITNSKSIINQEIITNDVFPLIYNGLEALVDIDEPNDMIFAEYLLKNNLIL